MKNKVIKLISISVIFILTVGVGCSKIEEPGGSDLVWDYPIKPGTAEWKSLASNEEKIAVCQIPENVLKTLTDSELLEVCLNYPLLNDIFVFNIIDHGVDKLINDFNGIRELYLRKNKSEVFLAKYSDLIDNLSKLNRQASDYEKVEYGLLISAVELLISRPEMQKDLALSDQKSFIQELWRAYKMKTEYTTYFGQLGFQTNIISRGKIISIIENNEDFCEFTGFFDGSYASCVDKKTKEILNVASV